MSAPTITSLVKQACSEADEALANHRVNARPALYAALGTCALICRQCVFDEAKAAELDTLFKAQPRGDRNRRYVEHGSDIYTRVARYAFAATNYTNVCRYAHCLREAEKSQIHPTKLAEFLATKGGVNALFYRRPLSETEVAAKVLRLSRKVLYPRDREFTLTLRWRDDNTFEPIQSEAAE